MKDTILEKGIKAKEASRKLAIASTIQKDEALSQIAFHLDKNRNILLEENTKDLEAGRKKGLSDAFIDRLSLNNARIDGMIRILKDVINLKDPVGEIFNMNTRPNGLKVGKMSVPIGVIGIIFESRPNVCIEVSSLTIKSGNSVILKGGSDAINSNTCLAGIIKKGLRAADLPESCVEIIDNTSRESVLEMVKMKDFIDVIIPRGGLQLIRFVEENSQIPVIRHDMGICHTYVDESANIKMAHDICYNAKVQRPGVCNAMETLLVNANIAPSFLQLIKKSFDKAGVVLKGCPETLKILPDIASATETDWNTEYLDLVLSVKIIDSIDEAIMHINLYGSHHSDAIVTENYQRGMKFITEVDSAACFINASTRFSDGNEFGLGAEMGISNQKLHVRGPMGLKDLTAPKYIIFGNGQIRD